MHGTSIGTLKVLKKSQLGYQTVWSLSGSQGNQWKRANVTLGKMILTEVAIRGIRGSSFDSDIALDDITFTDCTASKNLDTRMWEVVTAWSVFYFIITATNLQCSANQWLCGDGHCIDSVQFCDGRWDCPDNSDEIGCGQSLDRSGSHLSTYVEALIRRYRTGKL